MSDPGDETTASEPAPEPEPTPVAAIPAPEPPRVAAETKHRVNMLAVISLVLSAAYFVIGISLGLMGRTAPIVLPVLLVAALIAGYVARGQIWRKRERGRLVASAGVSLSYVGLGLLVFGWALTLLTFR